MIFLIVAAFAFTLDAQQITVNTQLGSVTGFHVNYGNNNGSSLWYGEGDIFLGIPFAQPPVGNLRFQAPQPIRRYPNGNVDASQYKAACPQGPGPMCGNQSEDCLYLNVYSPNVSTQNKYPVMIWIHGGALVSGCASMAPYKGAVRNLVSHGVVVVVLQYRLGLPGFFTTNTPDFPANRGLLDQLEALKWVQQNIASFGGNPQLVTLFGESAGSMSVSAHTFSPLSRGLFHQAIMESGSLFTTLDGYNVYKNLSATRAQQLCGIPVSQFPNANRDQLLGCMNTLQPQQWTALDQNEQSGWPIVLDNNFLPATPETLNSQRQRMPVIYGNMKDEYAFVLYISMGPPQNVPMSVFSRQYVQKLLQDAIPFYGSSLPLVWNVTSNAYLPKGTSDSDAATWWMTANNMLTGLTFTQWIVKDAKMQLENENSNVYLFEQTYPTKMIQPSASEVVTQQLGGYRPVAHTAELPYIWMMADKFWVSEFDVALANAYGLWWTNFAKHGRPTLDGSWSPVQLGANQLNHWRIDDPQKGGMQTIRGYRDRDDFVYQQLLPNLLARRSAETSNTQSFIQAVTNKY
ncbi:unnamed protein product, partial [Mesorhabditis belari]|uniref:Carboxylic ester hydrolase n=1 Tax=Mesorhabditis belari TaxID=2138241 RepID=A0AAF3FA05_9BILA